MESLMQTRFIFSFIGLIYGSTEVHAKSVNFDQLSDNQIYLYFTKAQPTDQPEGYRYIYTVVGRCTFNLYYNVADKKNSSWQQGIGFYKDGKGLYHMPVRWRTKTRAAKSKLAAAIREQFKKLECLKPVNAATSYHEASEDRRTHAAQ